MGKSKETPQTRSREYLMEQGFHPWTVEQNVRYPDKIPKSCGCPNMIAFKRDCYNFADIIAVRHDAPGVTFVQTTSSSNQAARIEKIKENSYVRTILQAGNKIFVHGWKLRKKRGTKQSHWSVTVTEISIGPNGLLIAGVLGEERKQEFSQPTLLPFMGIEASTG